MLKAEGIYGEKPLRWAYETIAGRCALEAVIKRRWFSALYGCWADCRCSAKEIASFIRNFELNPDEFLEAPETFQTFNQFFHRKLKEEARPVDEGAMTGCFPADGRHLFVPNLDQEQPLYAKGQRLNLAGLLGDSELSREFAGGSAILSRLCPTDYHRFHFPFAGQTGTPQLINGNLYSVNPIALARNIHYITENKRRHTRISESPVGSYLFLEVGATNVGSIIDTSEPGISVQKGEEKGYFRFGGSMVITLFKAGTFHPVPDLEKQSRNGIELYARMGDLMGEATTGDLPG